MMLRHITPFLLLCLFMTPTMAEDDTRYYNVEFILFEHSNPANFQAEDWTPHKQTADTEQTEVIHELGQPFILKADSIYDPHMMFTPVPEAEYRLIEEAKKIDESNSRRVLMHTAWRQPGMAKEQAIRVHFKQLIAQKTGDDNTTSDSSAFNNTTTPAASETPYLEGSIKVMLARYLHVDTDIFYYAHAPQVPAPANTEDATDIAVTTEYNENENQLSVYQMKQLRRRMRSKEVHYLDHPVLGMLMIITPVEKPETAEQNNTTPKGYSTIPR